MLSLTVLKGFSFPCCDISNIRCFPNSAFTSCERALRHLCDDVEVRDVILGCCLSYFDDNVPWYEFSYYDTDIWGETADIILNYMGNPEQVFVRDQLVSDDNFFRLKSEGLGLCEQRVNIYDNQYQGWDSL